jgi:hypothetical protein
MRAGSILVGGNKEHRAAATAGPDTGGFQMSQKDVIDCDIHPNVPSLKALLPYLSEHWREVVITRGMDELNSISYPANSPIRYFDCDL